MSQSKPGKTPKSPKMSEAAHVNGESGDDSPIQTRSRSKTPQSEPSIKVPESPSHNHNTRSRSRTPLVHQEAELELSLADVPEVAVEVDVNNQALLIVPDKEEDASPELLFDENDVDVESEGSPNRCKTRRSQTSLVSTPKTPKVPDDEDAIEPDHDTSETQSSVSLDNVSTVALSGGDVTRNIDVTLDAAVADAYVSPDRSLSLQETLRNMSPRRTIRSYGAGEYRKLALENVRQKQDDGRGYDLIERVAGVKRKSSSIQLNESEAKKFKEGAGIFNYICTLKNSITGSKAKKVDYEENGEQESNAQVETVTKSEQRWCSIM